MYPVAIEWNSAVFSYLTIKSTSSLDNPVGLPFIENDIRFQLEAAIADIEIRGQR